MGGLSAVEIRPITSPDAEQLAHLHLAGWEEAYADLMPASVFAERRARLAERIEVWRRIITEAAGPTIVAVRGQGLIGFASAGPARDEVGVAEELWALYVRASWYGKGLGHRSLTEVLAARPAYLWVLQGNDRAIEFYRRHGFEFDGAAQVDEVGTELRMVRRAEVDG